MGLAPDAHPHPSPYAYGCTEQGWQSTDHPGKPRWENPGFPGLGNTPRNGSTGQYWVIRYFPPVFIMKYFKLHVLLLKLNTSF